MRHTPKRLAVILAATFPCFAAAAENTVTLDSVVVSGSRVEHNTFDLPAAVDVVDAERIGADQARVNASEALVAVPGITVQNRQNYAQDLQISSRGFGARSAFGVRGIRLVADGIPASMPDGQGQAATFNLDRAERIEILRGPMAVTYGNHAGGVIQMFTPDGQGSPTLEGSFVGGSNNTWKEDVSFQGETGGLGYVVDTSHFTTDGYRQHSKAERDQTMVKLTYRPTEDGKLTFLVNSFKQTAEDPQGQTWAGYQANPRSVAAPALTYNTRKSIDHMQGGLTYEQRFGDHSVFVSAYAGQRSTLAFQSIPKATQQASASHSGGVIDFDRDFAGASTRWVGRFQLAGGKLTTTVGVEYEQAIDNRRGYENFIGTKLGVKGAQRRAEEDRVATFDQYAQAEWQGERWTFSGGVRHSQVSFNVKDAFLSNGDGSGDVSYEKATPTVAAMYRLTPSVNVYASAARGFEAPTFNELFYSGPSYSFSYNLKPSTSTHYETGLKAFIGSSSRFDLAVFQIETKDELVVDSADSGRTSYRNAGQTVRRGIETALDSRWAYNISSRIAYTYLDARYDQPFTSSSGLIKADNRLPGVAANTLFGELAWKHPASGFHAAVEGIARSKVYVEDTNTKQAAPGYAIANLRFGVDRQYGAVNLRTFLRFDNLFDRQYVGSVIVGDSNFRYYEAAPGRTWLAGISARYSF